MRFEDRLVTEDVFFNLRQCEGWESLCALDTAALHYRHRSAHTSITGRFVPDYFEQNRERVQELLALYDRWGCADAHVLAVLGGIYARYLFAAIERLYDPRSGVDAAGRRAFLRARFDAGQDLSLIHISPFSGADDPATRLAADTSASMGRVIKWER